MISELTEKFKYAITSKCSHGLRWEEFDGPKVDEKGVFFEYYATCKVCGETGYQRFDLKEKDIWGEK